MTAKKNGLRSVPNLVGKTGFQYRFDVAAQVMAAGAQDIHVQLIVPLSGPGKGQIGVRVGRLLVYGCRQVIWPHCLDEFWPRHLMV